jgi:hypothetical protein
MRHRNVDERAIATRFERAQELLNVYARATCVITSRLHAALPCVAFGTPVMVIDIAGDQYRFSGLNDFFHHAGLEEFLSGRARYDFNSPPPNPKYHIPLRDALVARVTEFIRTTNA